MIFEETLEIIKTKKIWDIICFDQMYSEKNTALFFKTGEAYLKMATRDKDDYHIRRFKKYVKPDGDYFYVDIRSDYSFYVYGYWELSQNEALIFSNKSENKIDMIYCQDLFNFLFQGHTVKNVQRFEQKKIRIDFSNGMAIDIIAETKVKGREADGWLEFKYDDSTFGLSIEEGIIDAKRIAEKWKEF